MLIFDNRRTISKLAIVPNVVAMALPNTAPLTPM